MGPNMRAILGVLFIAVVLLPLVLLVTLVVGLVRTVYDLAWVIITLVSSIFLAFRMDN